MSLFKIRRPGGQITSIDDLTREDWGEIQAAARFCPVSGRRADELVVDGDGHLWIIDTCGEAHWVDASLFLGVAS